MWLDSASPTRLHSIHDARPQAHEEGARPARQEGGRQKGRARGREEDRQKGRARGREADRQKGIRTEQEGGGEKAEHQVLQLLLQLFPRSQRGVVQLARRRQGAEGWRGREPGAGGLGEEAPSGLRLRQEREAAGMARPDERLLLQRGRRPEPPLRVHGGHVHRELVGWGDAVAVVLVFILPPPLPQLAPLVFFVVEMTCSAPFYSGNRLWRSKHTNNSKQNGHQTTPSLHPHMESGAEDPVHEPAGQEAKNRPNIPLQEKFHRGVLRGLRNISDTP